MRSKGQQVVMDPSLPSYLEGEQGCINWLIADRRTCNYRRIILAEERLGTRNRENDYADGSKLTDLNAPAN